MNKEQSADDPSVDLIRKNMLNSTISMSYPDVVIACIEQQGVSGSIQSNWGSVVANDNKEGLFPAVDWSP